MTMHACMRRNLAIPCGFARLSRRVQDRALSHSPRAMLSASEVSISAGEDHPAVLEQASQLVDGGKWQLCAGGKGLERVFGFQTFKTTWAFMGKVAAECASTRHHPEWSNVYNKTHIRWTTHRPEGLSHRDTAMARFCDEAAKELNELPSEPGDMKLRAAGRLESGDCCTPAR